MKVAYLSLMTPPGQPAVSGVPKVSETLLREFEGMSNLTVDVVTLVDGLGAERREERGSVRYHYLPCVPRGKTATLYAREVWRLRRVVAELRPDIVHGQPTAEYLLAATGAGWPHVITIHGLVLREARGLARLHPGFVANYLRELLQRRAARRAANLISITPYVTEYLAGWAKGRIWPISNPIDPEFFSLPPVRREGLRIICVGVVSQRKNQALLVEACGRLKAAGVKFECRIIGMPREGMEARLNAEIARLGMAAEVRVTGMVSRQELFEHYGWSNVVVLPSREETAPLSLSQGMAGGRVVMGAKAAGIPALLENGALGTLFAGEDAGALVDSLREFAAAPAAAWVRAEAATRRAAERFAPTAVARRTVETYAEILAGAG